ncbi:MAG: RnfABCDGE type electron transport complex subunit G [Candidatus Omnitrophica bacterium]|nr:RnfABCDGE type electron transport complex subunit G [Candidatus Omnitrophota bacterium]
MKVMVKYGFILGVICLLASSVLAVVNGVTEPKIALQKEKEEQAALKELMPDAVSFEPYIAEGKTEFYRAFDAEHKIKGFVLKCQGKGYSSEIEVLAGLDRALAIGEVKILSANETPGLGSKITEPSFRNQFKGKNLKTFDEIQAITGATISSRAVMQAIKNKMSSLQDTLTSEINNAQ